MKNDVKPRTRAGTYSVFERRYGPIDAPNGQVMREWNDIPPDTDARYIWTVIDCDGNLYLVPGYATVNYFARVLCERPWPDGEANNSGYLY